MPLLFGPAFGVDASNVSRDAIAMVAGSTGGGLVVLCPHCVCALKFSGNTDLTLTTVPGYVGDASIVVNYDATGCSPDVAAVCGSGGNLTIDAPEINIVAEGPESSCWSGNPVLPPRNPGSPFVPDPLAALPEPNPASMPDRGCIDSSGGGCPGSEACNGGTDDGLMCTSADDCPGGLCMAAPDICNLGDNHNAICRTDADCPGGSCLVTVHARPGYYPGGFRINKIGFRLILQSGVYSLDNVDGGPAAGLVINGGRFDATAGVLLHVVNDGVVQLAGSGDILISPITTPGDLYEGVSIFQSRTNYNDAVIIGSSVMNLLGTYYFPNNPVNIGGTGIALGNQLIASTLDLHGTGDYILAYDGRNPVPGYKVFLVE